MERQLIRDLLDLPETMPRCIVEINTFDDPAELRANIADYVITPTAGEELRRLVGRIIASVRRNEPGEGHYVHGAFGSGKSHFMGILGLVLANHPLIWEKDHPVIFELTPDDNVRLRALDVLVNIDRLRLSKQRPALSAPTDDWEKKLVQLQLRTSASAQVPLLEQKKATLVRELDKAKGFFSAGRRSRLQREIAQIESQLEQYRAAQQAQI